MKWLPG
jgi:hypothetical protein